MFTLTSTRGQTVANTNDKQATAKEEIRQKTKVKTARYIHHVRKKEASSFNENVKYFCWKTAKGMF